MELPKKELFLWSLLKTGYEKPSFKASVQKFLKKYLVKPELKFLQDWVALENHLICLDDS